MGKPNARERILETAAALFHRRGYCAVGINEIIEKADTAKATFYHHFPTKQALGVAWLQSIHDRSEARRKRMLASPEDPAAKIDACFLELATTMESSGFRGCPYTNTAAVLSENDELLRARIEDHKRSMRAFFRALAAALVGPGEQSGHDGDTLFVLYSGATTEAQNLRTGWPIDCARTAAAEICRREAATVTG